MKGDSLSDFSGSRFLRKKRVFRFLEVSSKNEINFLDTDLSSSPMAAFVFPSNFCVTLFDSGGMQEFGGLFWDENFDLDELSVNSYGGGFGLIWQWISWG